MLVLDRAVVLPLPNLDHCHVGLRGAVPQGDGDVGKHAVVDVAEAEYLAPGVSEGPIAGVIQVGDQRAESIGNSVAVKVDQRPPGDVPGVSDRAEVDPQVD